MTRKDAKRLFVSARAAVNAEIANIARSGDSLYAHGLASEGYAGGYRDALDDVMLVLFGDTIPNRRNYWFRKETP